MAEMSGFIFERACEQFNNALAFGESLFTLTPVELVRYGICDPVKVFIKDEPHKLSKIASGKLRLISSVSLVDQIKTRLLCNKQNTTEIDTWESIPSKPGLGLHDDGLLVIAENAKQILKYGPIAETDVGGWDWSVKQWELALDARIRGRLAGAKPTGAFDFLLHVHAYCVANTVYVTPDGQMFEQTFPGAQLSGDYNTSSTNSRMRLIATMAARLWAGIPPLIDGQALLAAMGDDSFEFAFPQLQENLNAIGHKVRMVDTRYELAGLKFCSQEFNAEGLAAPEDPTKTVYRFVGRKEGSSGYPELQVQLLWYTRHLTGPIKSLIGKISHARVERAKKIQANNGNTQAT